MPSEIDQSIAVFAIASWANNERAEDMANREIDDYVFHCENLGQDPLEALRALEAAYVDIMTDSATAKAIRYALKERIASLKAGGVSSAVNQTIQSHIS